MKYMGSKSRIKNDILPIILENSQHYRYYVEPFCGGLGTMDSINYYAQSISKVANDYNPFLIAMWKGLQMNLDKPMEIPKSLYDEYRNKFNNLKSSYDEVREIVNNTCGGYNFYEIFLIGWIGFMASFNGRFYDGWYSGKASGRDYVKEQISNTLNQVPLISEITFITYNYKSLSNFRKDSIVYCDIPYQGTKQYAFSKHFNYEEFWQWCRDVSKTGSKIFVSEYRAPSDFKCVWSKQVINSLNTSKTYKPIERLFTL